MDKSIKDKGGLLIGFALTALFLLLTLAPTRPIEFIENKLIDLRFALRGAITPPDYAVIAAIDEKSIEKLGRWPWPRTVLARLIDRLSEAGADIVVLDIILSESERNDPALAKSIDSAGNVVLPLVFDLERQTVEKTGFEDQAFLRVDGTERFAYNEPITAKGAINPLGGFMKGALGAGFINMFPDSDGVLRWEPLAISYGSLFYPSISLKTAALRMGVLPESVVLDAGRAVAVGATRIPTDEWGRTIINYYGGEETFRYVPIVDLVEGDTADALVAGKVVFVGASAVGVYDLRVTPMSAAMPGVEKHVNVTASILENKFLVRAGAWTNAIILAVAGMVFTLFVARLRAVWGVFVLAGFVFALLLAGYYLFTEAGVVIALASPLLAVFSIFICVMGYNYAVEERYAKQVRSMFSNYVTERVVNELIRNPALARMGGERREVTVLFSDIRSFTTFSEKHSPEEVVATLNEYLGAMTEVIFKWEGTLDKFIGDAIVVFWGAPLKQENHAELALKCALDMARRLEELRAKWRAEGKPELYAGIGINTGEVLVGNIGAEGKKMDYTVIGDHVNLGSRVESLTKRYSANILITEYTMKKIRPLIEAGDIWRISVKGQEKVVVKGKAEPVGLYEVKAIARGEATELIEIDETKVVVLTEK